MPQDGRRRHVYRTAHENETLDKVGLSQNVLSRSWGSARVLRKLGPAGTMA